MSTVAIVTGASQGIGLATSRLLAASGWRVVMVARNPDTLERAAATLDTQAGPPECISADLATTADLAPIVERSSTLGPLGLLVNNAGGTATRGILDASLTDFDAALAIDLRAAWELTRLAAAPMGQSGGGAVVNVSSTVGLATPHGRSLYSIAKGALIAQTRALAVDLADLGIRVNAVCPGPTLTDTFARASTPAALEARALTIPLKRLASPEDIANAVAFLGGPQSAHITGQSLTVDGGASAIGAYTLGLQASRTNDSR